MQPHFRAEYYNIVHLKGGIDNTALLTPLQKFLCLQEGREGGGGDGTIAVIRCPSCYKGVIS